MPQNNRVSDPSADLRNAIHTVASMAVLVRVYPKRRAVTHVFESSFYRTIIARETEGKRDYIIRQRFGNITDWRLAHDFYLPTGALYLTPEPYHERYVPEGDLTFGITPARLIVIGNGNDR
jgi:hypothetical protein